MDLAIGLSNAVPGIGLGGRDPAQVDLLADAAEL